MNYVSFNAPACQLLCQLLTLPLQQDGAGGAAGMLASALNFVAPTLVVGGLELGLWNFAASSTQALSLLALARTCDKRKSIEALMYDLC